MNKSQFYNYISDAVLSSWVLSAPTMLLVVVLIVYACLLATLVCTIGCVPDIVYLSVWFPIKVAIGYGIVRTNRYNRYLGRLRHHKGVLMWLFVCSTNMISESLPAKICFATSTFISLLIVINLTAMIGFRLYSMYMNHFSYDHMGIKDHYGLVYRYAYQGINLSITQNVEWLPPLSSAVVKVIVKKGVTISPLKPYYFDTIKELFLEENATILDCRCGASITKLQIAKGVTIDGGMFTYCDSLTQVNIAEDATIGNYAFEGCLGITQVNIAKGAKIGIGVFMGCLNIVGVNIGQGVTLGRRVFDSCRRLNKLSIGKNVSMGRNVFEGCEVIENTIIEQSAITDLSTLGNRVRIQNVSVMAQESMRLQGQFETDPDQVTLVLNLSQFGSVSEDRMVLHSLSSQAIDVRDQIQAMPAYNLFARLGDRMKMSICYQVSDLSFRFLSRAALERLVKIICCFKNHTVRLPKEIYLYHIIGSPIEERMLCYHGVTPTEESFAHDRFSSHTHWLEN